MKYAEQKIFGICVDVYKTNEGTDYDKLYDVLPTFKENLKINDILIENYKDMIENPNFEQHYWSRTPKGLYKIGHDSIRLMKC